MPACPKAAARADTDRRGVGSIARPGPAAYMRVINKVADMSPFAHILALPVRAYRLLFSPWVGHGCRYQPTCSAYALEALERHGALKGTLLAARRVGSCHPLGGAGYDPVPGSDPAHDCGQEQGQDHPADPSAPGSGK